MHDGGEHVRLCAGAKPRRDPPGAHRACPWAEAFGDGIGGVYLYTRECLHNGSAFHARMFAPQLGVPEDPATGSAAVCFAGIVHDFDGVTDGTHKRLIEQGHEMGRPSTISLTLVVSGGRLETVRIGGSAVRVIEGTLAV